MWEYSFRWRRHTVLLVRPAPEALGHLIYETKYAVATAAHSGAWLYLVPSPHCLNPAIFDLEFAGVRRIRNRAWLDAVLGHWADLDRALRRRANRREMDRRHRLRQRRRDPEWQRAAERRRRLGLGADACWAEREAVLRRRLRAARLDGEVRLLDLAIGSGPGRVLPKALRDRLRQARKRRRRILEKLPRLPGSAPLVTALGRLGAALRLPVPSLPPRPLRILPPGDRLYYRRDLMMAPPFARCPPGMVQRGDDIAARLGIAANARIVTVHARTGAFNRSTDVLVKQPVGREIELRDDSSARNADIANYLAAIDWLVGEGYTVVRLGNPSMPPVERPGVVDLATSPLREPLLDFYFVARSRFMMGSDSGPAVIAYLMATPLVYLNASHPAHCWPFGPRDLVVPKYVRDRASGRFLALEEMLSGRPLTHFKDTRFFDYVELTPEDVLTAVRELVTRLDAPEPPAETVLQRRCRDAFVAMLEDPEVPTYFQKWGCRDGLIGSGTIARFVVERNAGGCWQPPARSAATPAARNVR